MKFKKEQYLSKHFPLKKFYIDSIPQHLVQTLRAILLFNVALRGGIAYVLHCDRKNYELKDIDALGLEDDVNTLIETLSSTADEVFLNHNYAGENVLTAFWKSQEEYYKLDILFVKKIPNTVLLAWKDISVKCVPIEFIWCDRIRKIAERNIRNHPPQKTLNHYEVIKDLSLKMLKMNNYTFSISNSALMTTLVAAKNELYGLLPEADVNDFFELQLSVLRQQENMV